MKIALGTIEASDHDMTARPQANRSRSRLESLRNRIREAELALYEQGYADPDRVRYEATQVKLQALYTQLHEDFGTSWDRQEATVTDYGNAR